MPARPKTRKTATARRGKGAKSNPRVALKFRIEPERAALVQRIARAEGKSESDILREGVDLVERVRARREHLPKLADFIKLVPPEYRPRE